MVMQEMSEAECVVLLKDIIAKITFNRSNRKAYVFAGKESKQPVEDARGNCVEKEAYVFARKESKGIIADDFKGGKRPRILVVDEMEDKEMDRVRIADPEESKPNEAVKVKQLIMKNDVGQARKLFRNLEQSVESSEEVEEEILVDPKERRDEQKKKIHLLGEDCSTVGVQEDSNVYSQDGEDVKPEVVREASREEVLEAEDTIEKIKKAAAVKETFERFETAEVVHGKCERIDETAKAKAVNVAKVAVDKKEFSNVTESVENCKDSREQSNDSKCFANLFNFNIPAGSYAKFEYDKVKANEIDAKYAGECVKVTDAKKAGNPADDRENGETGIDVSRAVRCKADDVKPVRPVFESSVQIVEKVGAGVFAAESDVSKPAVGAGLMSSQEYGAGGHEYSKICEVDSGMGAGDLKQSGRLGVVERSSLLKQLLADVSQVEEPDGLTLAMDPVYTQGYKSDKHMYRKKYRVDSGQGAKVFEQPGRLDIAERDGPSQESFTDVSWVEEPSKLGQQYMQLAVTIYDENQAGMVQKESRDS